MEKILIVDDQELYLNSLAFALQNYFEITTAKSKAEAIDKLSDEFDLALIDICLDENDKDNADGLNLLEWISNNKPQISVFMISAYREFSYAEQALNLGAKHFFRKPLDILSLVAIIKEKG